MNGGSGNFRSHSPQCGGPHMKITIVVDCKVFASSHWILDKQYFDGCGLLRILMCGLGSLLLFCLQFI